MRSGTSFFDRTVFKKTIIRFWPLWGAYFVIWLVVLPLNGLMCLRMNSYSSGFNYMEEFARSRVAGSVTGNTCLTLTVVFGVLGAMAVFSHLYNARSANLFGSLPVKREGLFLTHYLAGLAFFLVPNVVIALLCLLVEAVGGYVFMEALLFWLAVTCGECFLFYSMAVFCAMFTGHILALPAFYAVLNGIVAGVIMLVEVVFRAFYYGFAGFSDRVYTVLKWFTPVILLEETVYFKTFWTDGIPGAEQVQNIRGLGTLGIYALAGLALTVCAFFLYRARRLESAGDVVSVRPMRPVFKYGVALCAGLAFGMGTTMFTGGGEAVLMVTIVVWGVIGYFAAEMLLQKSFRVFRAWKGAAAVAAVFVLLFVVVVLDLTGYETRIPDPASVDSVRVYTGNAVYLLDDGDRLDMDVTDPEIIRLLNILHQEAVAQGDEERRTQYQTGGVSTTLTLDYTLQGGGTMDRQYYMWLDPKEMNTEGTAAWAMQQLYDNRELYWQVYGFADLEARLSDGYRLERAAYKTYDEEDGVYTDAAFYTDAAATLLAAVKEDFFAGRIGVRRLDDEEHWHGRTPGRSLTFSAAQIGADGFCRVDITLQETASSTIAALEDLADRAVTSDSHEWWGYDG